MTGDSTHPANLTECGRRQIQGCAQLHAAWSALVRARKVPFSELHPLLWMTEFHDEASTALEAMLAHRWEMEGPDSLLRAREDEQAVLSQLEEHQQIEEQLTVLVENTRKLEAHGFDQFWRCRDAAFTGQLQLALHHWRLVQIIADDRRKRSEP